MAAVTQSYQQVGEIRRPINTDRYNNRVFYVFYEGDPLKGSLKVERQ